MNYKGNVLTKTQNVIEQGNTTRNSLYTVSRSGHPPFGLYYLQAEVTTTDTR